MTIENQVCSLGLAKQLKELGVKQHSIFIHYRENNDSYSIRGWNEPAPSHIVDPIGYKKNIVIPAFTVAELSELLPVSINIDSIHYFLCLKKDRIYKKGDFWNIVYRDCDGWSEDGLGEIFEKKLVDGLAKALIYLLEHNLITL